MPWSALVCNLSFVLHACTKCASKTSDGKSNCWNRYPADQQPNDPRKEAFNHPLDRCGNGRQCVSCSLGNGTDGVTDKMHIIRLEAMDNNAGANPDHGRDR